MQSPLSPKARAIIGGVCGLMLASLAAGGLLDSFENFAIDHALRFRPARAVSDEIRLIGIGDRDVGSQLGRWPFPRAVHADVLSILSAMGVRHTTFDVLFTEKSSDPSQDEKLKAAIKQHHNTTLAYYLSNRPA